jgi:hypothetical protein
MAQDIVLIGAGRSPHTRNLRRNRGFRPRNRWIGPVQVRTHMRIAVDQDFVKQHYDQIVQAVEDGVLLVEYKLDRFVDATELKTLAFGSEEERAAYEQEATQKLEESAAEYQRLSEEKKAEEDEAARLSVLGDMPVAKPGADVIPQGEARGDALTGGEGQGVPKQGFVGDEPLNELDRSDKEKGIQAESAPLNTIEGTREEGLTSPRDLAQARQEEVTAANAEGRTLVGQRDEEAEAAANSVEGAEQPVPTGLPTPEELTAQRGQEPEYQPEETGVDNAEATTDTDYKPLPEHWRTSTKPELLALCEERSIDTSDMPSNKELKRRLESYESRS